MSYMDMRELTKPEIAEAKMSLENFLHYHCLLHRKNIQYKNALRRCVKRYQNNTQTKNLNTLSWDYLVHADYEVFKNQCSEKNIQLLIETYEVLGITGELMLQGEKPHQVSTS